MPPALISLLFLLGPSEGPSATMAGVAVPSRGETAGVALVAEAGRHANGYGLGIIYYQPVRPIGALPVTLSAQVGVGIWGRVPRAVVAGGGIGASLGRRHRGLLGVGWEVIGRSILSLHGTRVADRSLYGPEVDGGYEFVSDGGPVIRALVGVGYLPRAWQEARPRFHAGVRLALGWKFW